MNLFFFILNIVIIKSLLAFHYNDYNDGRFVRNPFIGYGNRFVRNPFISVWRTEKELKCIGTLKCRDYPTDKSCGTNGQTYENECYLFCAIQCTNGLFMKHKRECGQHFFRHKPTHGVPYERPSSYNKDPSHTHYNQLKFRYYEELTRYGKTAPPTNDQRTSINAGVRNPYCDTWTNCPWCAEKENNKWIPFCGKDGYTYDNICDLECSSAVCYSAGHPGLIKFEGVCADGDFGAEFNKLRIYPTQKSATTTQRATTTRTTTTPKTTTPTTTTTTTPTMEYEEENPSEPENPLGLDEGVYYP